MDMTSNAGFVAVCATLNAAMPLKAIAITNALSIVLIRICAPQKYCPQSVTPVGVGRKEKRIGA